MENITRVKRNTINAICVNLSQKSKKYNFKITRAYGKYFLEKCDKNGDLHASIFGFLTLNEIYLMLRCARNLFLDITEE